VIRRRRLLDDHVEPRAANLALVQREDQGFFIEMDQPTRLSVKWIIRIDEPCGFHPGLEECAP
jgi:hypothetical protein